MTKDQNEHEKEQNERDNQRQSRYKFEMKRRIAPPIPHLLLPTTTNNRAPRPHLPHRHHQRTRTWTLAT